MLFYQALNIYLFFIFFKLTETEAIQKKDFTLLPGAGFLAISFILITSLLLLDLKAASADTLLAFPNCTFKT